MATAYNPLQAPLQAFTPTFTGDIKPVFGAPEPFSPYQSYVGPTIKPPPDLDFKSEASPIDQLFAKYLAGGADPQYHALRTEYANKFGPTIEPEEESELFEALRAKYGLDALLTRPPGYKEPTPAATVPGSMSGAVNTGGSAGGAGVSAPAGPVGGGGFAGIGGGVGKDGTVSTGYGGFSLSPSGQVTANTISGPAALALGLLTGSPALALAAQYGLNSLAGQNAANFGASIADTMGVNAVGGPAATAGPSGTGGSAAQAASNAASAAAATGASAAAQGAAAQAAADAVVGGQSAAAAMQAGAVAAAAVTASEVSAASNAGGSKGFGGLAGLGGIAGLGGNIGDALTGGSTVGIDALGPGGIGGVIGLSDAATGGSTVGVDALGPGGVGGVSGAGSLGGSGGNIGDALTGGSTVGVDALGPGGVSDSSGISGSGGNIGDASTGGSTVGTDALGPGGTGDFGTDGGGGGGGGGKIICTKLHELGAMPDDIYEADQAFGALLLAQSPETYAGYAAWAQHVVRWMGRDDWFGALVRRAAHAIATPWSIAMAEEMGLPVKSSWFGRALLRHGLQLCRFIGQRRAEVQHG